MDSVHICTIALSQGPPEMICILHLTYFWNLIGWEISYYYRELFNGFTSYLHYSFNLETLKRFVYQSIWPTFVLPAAIWLAKRSQTIISWTVQWILFIFVPQLCLADPQNWLAYQGSLWKNKSWSQFRAQIDRCRFNCVTVAKLAQKIWSQIEKSGANLLKISHLAPK